MNNHKQKVPHPLSFAEGSKALFFGNKLNLLLAFVPLAIGSAMTGGSDGLVFSLSCIGLLPLANLLGALLPCHDIEPHPACASDQSRPLSLASRRRGNRKGGVPYQ